MSGRREALRRWQGLIAQQANSGLSIAEFCRRREVTQASFFQWRRKLAESPAASEPFVPLSVVGHAGVSVELPCGAIVRLPVGDEQSLKQVLSALLTVEGENA